MAISTKAFNQQVNVMEKRLKEQEKRLLDAISCLYDTRMMEIPIEILNKPLRELTESDLEYLKSNGSSKNTDCSEKENDGISGRDPCPKIRKQSTRVSKAAKYKTPARLIKTPMSAMVTPKFNPHTSMSVMRKPKEGEIAMSMSGSPLHVAIINSKPNVVVPLQDGKVLSVLPERGIRRSEIPLIHPDLRRQLTVLNENLSAILDLNK